jgi:hypothetical protein
VLKRVNGREEEELADRLRKVHDGKLNKFYSSPNRPNIRKIRCTG